MRFIGPQEALAMLHDDMLLREPRSRVYVDCYATAVADVGEIASPIREGALQREHIAGDLRELCTGKRQGQGCTEEIRLLRNAGGGRLDLMTAELITQRATV